MDTKLTGTLFIIIGVVVTFISPSGANVSFLTPDDPGCSYIISGEITSMDALLSKITTEQKSLPCFYWHFRQELEYLKVGFLLKMLSELSQI